MFTKVIQNEIIDKINRNNYQEYQRLQPHILRLFQTPSEITERDQKRIHQIKMILQSTIYLNNKSIEDEFLEYCFCDKFGLSELEMFYFEQLVFQFDDEKIKYYCRINYFISLIEISNSIDTINIINSIDKTNERNERNVKERNKLIQYINNHSLQKSNRYSSTILLCQEYIEEKLYRVLQSQCILSEITHSGWRNMLMEITDTNIQRFIELFIDNSQIDSSNGENENELDKVIISTNSNENNSIENNINNDNDFNSNLKDIINKRIKRIPLHLISRKIVLYLHIYFPPYSSEGSISPSTAAESITPAAKESTISENLCEVFLKIKPMSEPMTVAPPTPSAVSNTSSIKSSFEVDII